MYSEQTLVNYLKTLMDMASYSLILDRDLKIIHYSDNLHKLMGRPENEPFTGMHLLEIYDSFDDELFVKEATRRLSRIVYGPDEEFSEDDTVVWPTGLKRIYRITYRRIRDRDGGFDGAALISRDVTELHLEEAERHINDLLYSTSVPCMIWNETGDVIAYNDAVLKTFGIPDGLPTEEFTRQFYALHPTTQPDGQLTEEIRLGCLNEALDNGFAQVTVMLHNSSGAPIYFMVNVARITWLFSYRLIIYFNDLTEIKAREEEIEEAQERIMLMLDSNPMACLLRDENDIVIDCNKAALEVFGVTDKHDFFNNFTRFYPEYQPDGSKSLERVAVILRELFDKGAMDSFEWTFRTATGEPLPAEVTLVRIQWEGKFRCLSYYRDLREIHAKEQSLQEIAEKEREAMLQKEAAEMANEAKSQFLANMSHEIRTPMNAVLGMTELLLHENLSKRQYRYVEDMKTSATALLSIINDILDVSKIQAGKLSLIPIHYDFDMLIDNIGSIAQFLVDGKDIAFKMSIEEHEDLCLYGDDVRLRQVLLNLLGNAVKFTNAGYVQLAIGFTDETIRITVSDTGIGIPKESIPTLFDAFEQADVLKNRDKTGTGLGLTIAKSIVEMMGGTISVESVYGQGASFHIELPKVPGDEALIHNIEDKEIAITAPSARVLVVDDNRTNLNVASGLLQLCKIETDTATSGGQAIEMVRQNDYDIVFMDQRMPEMSGIQTTMAIRESGNNVPIIALTASAVPEAKEKMFASGMNDYLSKPIIKTELLNALRKWIPADKIVKSRPAAASAYKGLDDSQMEFWERVEQSEGLDIAIGLSRVDGQRDVYEKSLKLIVPEIEKSNTNLIAFLSADDMENFRIEVHGIKTALANIGAMELSEKAFELEAASGKNDTAFCVSSLPLFLEGLIKLKMNLMQALACIRHDPETDDAPAELFLICDRLSTALVETDLLMIEEEVDKLNGLNLTGVLKDEVEWIKDAVLMMNYDGAINQICDLLAKHSTRDCLDI